MVVGIARGKLVLFDLCDTLYDANTTMDFIGHYHTCSGSRHIGRVIRRWSSKHSPYFYLGALSHRFFGDDLARKRIIASLARQPRGKLSDVAADYVQNILPARANGLLHDRLREHLNTGDQVILLSSSLDIIVSEVASKLGLDYRASRLGFNKDLCTGRLERDLTGRKSEAVSDLLGAATYVHVYTDNRSDRDLVQLADCATIVIPRGASSEPWGGKSCEYLRL